MAAITLAEIDAKIQALLENPEVDYKMGQKTVFASQKLKQLYMAREQALAHPSAEIEFMDFNMGKNEFGQALGETMS